RIVAAAIEQNHDERGIIWPEAIAPFRLAIVPLNHHKSDAVREAAEELYEELTAKGVDVILDDRNERPGVKYADMELMGIPHRIVISDRSLDNGTVKCKGSRDSETQDVKPYELEVFLAELMT